QPVARDPDRHGDRGLGLLGLDPADLGPGDETAGPLDDLAYRAVGGAGLVGVQLESGSADGLPTVGVLRSSRLGCFPTVLTGGAAIPPSLVRVSDGPAR